MGLLLYAAVKIFDKLVFAVHRFFGFLSTAEGLWLKNSVGLIILGVLTYMVFSEYMKNRRLELRYLTIAFGLMLFQIFVSFFFMFMYLFGNVNMDFYLFPLFEKLIGIIVFFLLGSAFVYPIVIERKEKIKKFIREKISLVSTLAIMFIILITSTMDLIGSSFNNYFSRTIFVCFEITILIYFTYFILMYSTKKTKYKQSYALGFLFLLVSPVLELIQILLYQGYNPSLNVASQPFPFLAILLFYRAIYLKLVDKAHLLNILKLSNEKLKYEKKLGGLKDEFVSVVSHELRTPLTSMKLYTSLLEMGKFGKVSKKQKSALKIIKQENDRLAGLITDVLDLSKIESEENNLNLIKFNLFEISNESLYLNLAKKKKIKVTNNVPKKFIVNADKNKIKQIFINLFNNSIKFTPKKGKIIFNAKFKDDKKSWIFSMKDTGQGIEKSKLEKIFDKFTQVEEHMTRQEKGFGLGLAIVKKIVEMHNGKISVESEVGKGTNFTIQIPAKIKIKSNKTKKTKMKKQK
ncbi:GHKL domain-containing protein [Candidatus Woesearchaeota archaeon]|jgi:signal transduction histidine kinase|nr:GHKL domain-containing protein [Candidatus Woesearchaeota archaeon]MBT5423097.1 GHKL domain-containing protein [archaeon]MBT7368809.1 GHKL domain-containing protein [Candidatus Woesearchaeota archaeon]